MSILSCAPHVNKRIPLPAVQPCNDSFYCTVNAFALVVVPPALVTEIFPVLAPDGTVTRMKFAVSTVKGALVPLMATSLVPTKWDPCRRKVEPGLPLVG